MISTEIARLQQAKADIKTAIEAKGVTVPSNALIDTYDDYVAAIQQGGGGNPQADEKDVNFIDYDGTIRYSYTAAEFAALTALPANPTHDGLTAQGWNWALSDAKTYVAKYGMLDIGQMYITSDGYTKLYIEIVEDNQAIKLYISKNSGDTFSVSWGDNDTSTVGSGTSVTKTHTYTTKGRYIISFNAAGKTVKGFSIGDYGVNQRAIYKIELGSGIYGITYNAYAPFNCQTITIPSSVSEFSTNVSFGGFADWRSLQCVVVPPNISFSTKNANFCENAYSLRYLSLPKLTPTSGTGYGYFCDAAYSLRRVILPEGFSAISFGNNLCVSCATASKIIAAGTTSSQGLTKCTNLGYLRFLDGTTELATYTANGAYSLNTLILPSSITSIGGSSFTSIQRCMHIYIYATTPPALGSSCFSSFPSTGVIHVPNGSLSAYQGATNWSSFSSKMVEMPAS